MNEEFEKYLEMAKAYLAKKERKNYYETEGYDDDFCRSAYMLTDLSDEEANQLKALKEKYGKDEFVNHLKEVFDDEDYISDLFYGEPIDIDLENVYHQYNFPIQEIKEGKVISRGHIIELSDENYAKLLAWHLFDEHLVINTLYYHDEPLYKEIMRKSILYYNDDLGIMCSTPFVVTMDEAIADTEQIIKENNIKRDGMYRMLFV